VRGAIDAWTQHRHLELRPDEVWFEILVQMNFYMAAHAEDVRKLFVDHDGKDIIYIQNSTWQGLVAGFGNSIQDRVKTDWLLEWVRPGFSTSTSDDELKASVLLMGLMQHYFEYFGEIKCGIPSVTLLGTREDWVALLKKTDRLHEFGAEPAKYASNLRPLLSRFVLTFDEPDSDEVRDFWRQIVSAHPYFTCGGPEQYMVTGWLVGFLYWHEDGSLRDYSFGRRIVKGGTIVYDYNLGRHIERGATMAYDDIIYLSERLDHLPVGYAKAPMTIVNYPEMGVNTSSYLLAGNIGKEVRPGVAPSYLEAIERDKNTDAEFAVRTVEDEVTVRPMSSWFLYAPVDFDAEVGSFGSGDEIWSMERAFDKLQCV
jgi:hypothetical protein